MTFIGQTNTAIGWAKHCGSVNIFKNIIQPVFFILFYRYTILEFIPIFTCLLFLYFHFSF